MDIINGIKTAITYIPFLSKSLHLLNAWVTTFRIIRWGHVLAVLCHHYFSKSSIQPCREEPLYLNDRKVFSNEFLNECYRFLCWVLLFPTNLLTTRIVTIGCYLFDYAVPMAVGAPFFSEGLLLFACGAIMSWSVLNQTSDYRAMTDRILQHNAYLLTHNVKTDYPTIKNNLDKKICYEKAAKEVKKSPWRFLFREILAWGPELWITHRNNPLEVFLILPQVIFAGFSYEVQKRYFLNYEKKMLKNVITREGMDDDSDIVIDKITKEEKEARQRDFLEGVKMYREEYRKKFEDFIDVGTREEYDWRRLVQKKIDDSHEVKKEK